MPSGEAGLLRATTSGALSRLHGAPYPVGAAYPLSPTAVLLLPLLVVEGRDSFRVTRRDATWQLDLTPAISGRFVVHVAPVVLAPHFAQDHCVHTSMIVVCAGPFVESAIFSFVGTSLFRVLLEIGHPFDRLGPDGLRFDLERSCEVNFDLGTHGLDPASSRVQLLPDRSDSLPTPLLPESAPDSPRLLPPGQALTPVTTYAAAAEPPERTSGGHDAQFRTAKVTPLNLKGTSAASG